ncbi:Alpha/Beta hydrolase protein [Phyllosticta capitalensis]
MCPTVLHHQPVRGLYALYAITLEAIRMPIWMLLFLIPSLRPCPQWTHPQAVRHKILKAFVYHSAMLEILVPLSLSPGREGNRFVVMPPAESSLYQGPMVDKCGTVRPEKIGGTWYPTPYPSPVASGGPVPTNKEAKNDNDHGFVVLHFHGGAFVLGDGRERDCGPLARGMLRCAGPSGVRYIFCPQYRLAGPPSNVRFPGALQDAVTSYAHLLRTMRIPTSRIVVSGDSAGGNIVFALLRYISEYGAATGLPPPAAAWCWSPWINPSVAIDKKQIARSPNYGTDYLSKDFGAWGARVYVSPHVPLDNPYVSGGPHPFYTATPVFVQTGGAEVLFHENVEWVESMQKVKGNRIFIEIVDYAPHDIPLIAHIAGFAEQYDEAATKAGEFLRTHATKA